MCSLSTKMLTKTKEVNRDNAPTRQKVYRGEVSSRSPQDILLRCNPEAGALRQVSGKLPDFLLELSAELPEMSDHVPE